MSFLSAKAEPSASEGRIICKIVTSVRSSTMDDNCNVLGIQWGEVVVGFHQAYSIIETNVPGILA